MNFIKGILLFSIIAISTQSSGKGDLALRSKKIELQLGSDKSDYDMSTKEIRLETGKAYRLEI